MIITAASYDYKKIVELSTIQNNKLGYKPTVYDIEKTMNYGIPFYLDDFLKDINEKVFNSKISLGAIPYKPYIIKKALLEYKENITWFDADAFAIKSFDSIYNDDFDIAVTMRGQSERYTYAPLLNGLINAGVCFFHNTKNTLDFINLWIKELKNTMYLSDQEALNRLVLRCCELKEDCYNNVYKLGDIKIKILKTDEYNYYYYPILPDKNTKILHLKTNLRNNNEKDMLEWFSRDWNKV